MSISSATRKSGPYTGNNVTTAFSFAFKVFLQSEIVVVRTDLSAVETTLALSTDYTVTLNADQTASPGGSITLLGGPLATGFLLTITSNVAALQPVVLTNSGGFYPSIINDEFDRLTILLQQVAEQAARAVKTQISSGINPDTLVASLLAAASSAAASATAAANSATAAANAVPSGSLAYTPVNLAGDTMTGNLALPGINVGGSGVVTSLGTAATKTVGAAAGDVPLWDYLPLNSISAKSAAYTIVPGDRGKLIDYTTAGFNLTLDVSVGAAFSCAVRNSAASGNVTLISTAVIDGIAGATGISLAPGDSCHVIYDGAAWKTVGRTNVNIAGSPTQVFSMATAAPGTNTTQGASTAFVQAATGALSFVAKDQNYNNVGSYCLCEVNTLVGVAAGATIAGSSLYPMSVPGGNGSSVATVYQTTLPGTWRCCGYVNSDGSSAGGSLFQRIA